VAHSLGKRLQKSKSVSYVKMQHENFSSKMMAPQVEKLIKNEPEP
jgi:hypothetical protein